MEFYKLRPLTDARLDEVAADWATYDEDAFAVELATVFSWCRDHLTHREGDSYAMELYATSTGETHAILEMINSKRGALSKMLKLWTSPKHWNTLGDEDRKREAIELHIGAFVSVIGNGVNNGFDEVKIYGRTNTMLDMLQTLGEVWNKRREANPTASSSAWTATMAGRWLAISRVK